MNRSIISRARLQGERATSPENEIVVLLVQMTVEPATLFRLPIREEGLDEKKPVK